MTKLIIAAMICIQVVIIYLIGKDIDKLSKEKDNKDEK